MYKRVILTFHEDRTPRQLSRGQTSDRDNFSNNFFTGARFRRRGWRDLPRIIEPTRLSPTRNLRSSSWRSDEWRATVPWAVKFVQLNYWRSSRRFISISDLCRTRDNRYALKRRMLHHLCVPVPFRFGHPSGRLIAPRPYISGPAAPWHRKYARFYVFYDKIVNRTDCLMRPRVGCKRRRRTKNTVCMVWYCILWYGIVCIVLYKVRRSCRWLRMGPQKSHWRLELNPI